MKKINLSNVSAFLSEKELKNITGGSAKACGTGGRGHGDPCVTGDGRNGICGYYMGIYGCVPR
ncbi:TIGR04149 family rSAM-modified RiPP [Sphingobacterium sp. GVS05A]|uniref:TIGR04149 family rSAM-modified RiPP n=1 Tax=Sphingobacterium TaxID=28453 RepID=UPI001CBEFFDB|nr:TIGR04149 family rSAM-modified RiPP [Sphingobacterium sp. GVS05A]